GSQTLLFVDEIHRFNKAQQDAFLPHVEDGTIALMGATTENPSFEVNSALLSRMKVVVLRMLSEDAIRLVLRRAMDDAEGGLGKEPVESADAVLDLIARHSEGDARIALNTLEAAAQIAARRAKRALGAREAITEDDAREGSQRAMLPYDRAGEEH